MHPSRTGIIAAVGFIVVAMAATGPVSAAPALKSTIVVSVLPQSYFVQRIAGDRAKVITLVGPGKDPHSYEPTPRQMVDLSAAAIWFTVGVEFEHGLQPKIASMYPSLRIIDSAAGIVRRPLEAHDGGEDHEDEGLDPHVWLGRDESLHLATIVRDALTALDPAGASFYRQNYDALSRDVEAVFKGLARELEPLRGRAVFVYHPAFGYFLDEFGIIQKAVETGGKEPTQRGLAALAEEAKKEGTKVLFVQAQFPTTAARTLAAAMGGVVVPLDPLAADWLGNIRRMGDALKKAAK